jgi:hypothetical protein
MSGYEGCMKEEGEAKLTTINLQYKTASKISKFAIRLYYTTANSVAVERSFSAWEFNKGICFWLVERS